MSLRRATALPALMLVSLVLIATGCSAANGPSSLGGPSSSANAQGSPSAQSSPSSKNRQGTDNTPVTPNSDFTLPEAIRPGVYDSQGRLEKQIGELAGVTVTDDKQQRLVDFSVASITVDYKCQTDTDIKPSNGHFIAVELWIQTRAELASSQEPFFGVSPKEFDLIGPDGKTVTSTLDTRAGHACLDNGLGLPARIAPGQKIRGLVVLDSPIASGSLMLSQRTTKGPGWIWDLPPAQAAR